MRWKSNDSGPCFGSIGQQQAYPRRNWANGLASARRGISDLERGLRGSPYPATVRRLADALGLGAAERAELLVALGRKAADGPRLQMSSPNVAQLPDPLTSFVGRQQELLNIRRLLRTGRLLTLVGVGGVGKTRLALEAARQSPTPVFVDLASLSDPQAVPATVLRALGLREQPDESPLNTLTRNIAARELLVVLDNCEHLVGACAELADGLLRACPNLRILATSREGLSVSGEQLWPVTPLRLPGSDGVDPSTSEAVQLFAERARLGWPDFRVDAANGQLVGDVCRRLDGLPLAIELAAARLPALGLEQLAARLDDRFRVLTTTSRTAPRRQQTLRAVVDWSHELLTDPEKRLFRRLAVFAGGWTVPMAEEVCSGAGLVRAEILETLSRLIQQSLVLLREDNGETRYGFLDTVKEYAADCLRDAGEDQLTRDEHLRWCVNLAERADADKDSPRRASLLDVLAREHGNLRQALEWSLVEPRTAQQALDLAGSLGWFWWLTGPAREGDRWMSRVLGQAQAGADSANPFPVQAARAWALAEAGRLRQRQGDLTTAQALLEEGLALAQKAASRRAEAGARLYLGELSLEQGDSTAARLHLLQGLELAQDPSANAPAPYRFLHWLGHVEEADGRPDEAASLYAEARARAESRGDALFAAVATRGLASAAIERGDLAAARGFLGATLALARQVGNATAEDATLVAYFARLASAEGQPVRALILAGAASGVLEETGTRLFRHDRDLLGRSLVDARRLLSADAAMAAEAEGRAMQRHDALALLTAALQQR